VDNPYINKTADVSNAATDAISNIRTDNTLGTINTNDFIKGALIGAVATYLLTNESAQKAIFKSVAKGAEMFQAGIEEMKERVEDAKAELEAQKN
jgi:gas vesicle protein